MKVFKPLGEEGHELVHAADDRDYETMNVAVNGTPRAATWKPIAVRLVTTGDDGEPLRESDAPWLSANAFVLRRRAAEALAPALRGHWELLPLSCPTADLVVANPLHLVDALDEASSKVQRFKDDNRIFIISKHVFFPERIQGLPIFKIPQLRVSPSYVTEPFVAAWKAAGLRGLTFKQVWAG